MQSLARPVVFVARWLGQHWKLSLFILVIGGAGWWFIQRKTHPPIVQLKFFQVKQDKLVKKLSVSGVIDAKQKASLHFVAGGKIVYLGAHEGDVVKKWQTLARIDSADLQKRLAQDLNLYFNERMDFEQNKEDRRDLAPTNALNRESQKDQKTLENSVLDVEIRDIAIRNNTLATPIAGILVTAPTPVSGVNLAPTDVFEVIDPSTLLFKAAVAETDIAEVKKGQTANIELDAYPDQPISATVSAIAYRSSQTSKGTVFVVELPILNSASSSASASSTPSLLERYRLGMNGDSDITVAQKENVLQVPIDALIEKDNKKFVRKRTGPNSAEQVEIETGLETDEMVEVTKGFSVGDEVVLP